MEIIRDTFLLFLDESQDGGNVGAWLPDGVTVGPKNNGANIERVASLLTYESNPKSGFNWLFES